MKQRIIYLIAITLLAASCTSDEIDNDYNTLSGDGTKTPLSVTALLDAGGASTRAANMTFEKGDEFVALIRHVKATATTTNNVTTFTNITNVPADNAPALVTFKFDGDMETYTGGNISPVGLADKADKTLLMNNQNTQQTATGSLTASYSDGIGTVNGLYWDDFSANSANDGTVSSTYLRDKGHYLQSFFGYCFNGGQGNNNSKGSTVQEHITAALNTTDGTLGWKVAEDQSATNTTDPKAFQHSDLLWSAEQNPISYAHVDGQGQKKHGTLLLPFTHAMSKVTVNISLDASFGEGAYFHGVSILLHNMFTHCICTAPNDTLTQKGTATAGATTNITMKNSTASATSKATTCQFEAIVVPSVLSSVNNFATISGLDGNNYIIPITDKMLQVPTQTDNTGWGAQLTKTNEHISDGVAQKPSANNNIPQGRGYEMKSGVNYVLNVNISKQQITVSASIKDWVTVEANGDGLVMFNPDINGKGDIASELQTRGFDVFKSNNNNAFGTRSTTLTWDQTNSKWTYNPTIYWGGQQDLSYFRALSPASTSLNMSQGTDMLWGYACDDDANNGNKVGTANEVAITPRTGDVPLHFLHPMSKISVELKTSDDDAKKVNLAGAKLSIINLYDKGTLSITDGSIGSLDYSVPTEPYTFKDQTFDANNKWSDKIVIPQSLVNDKDGNTRNNFPTFFNTGGLEDKGDKIVMYLVLADGTRYRLEMSTCVVTETGVSVTEWERNKHYTYTIHIEKEAIIFRGMVKDWDPVSGSGNANLEWD